MKIAVKKIDEGHWEVGVEGPPPTTHRVHLSGSYYQKLAREGESPESLIERSFRFLLEREPNTSILSSFELPLIGRYFPEYEDVIRN